MTSASPNKEIIPFASSQKKEVLVTSNTDGLSSRSVLHPYSSFPKSQKWLIIILAAFAATFSPLSSFIFFPAVTALSEFLHVSIAKINLTITSYMVVAGIAPAVLGDLADSMGRRVVYLLMMSIYCAANVGLAFQSNWTALFILRMVQSAGSAATIAIGCGVVSDIASPAERGEFFSRLVFGPNIAAAIGPVIGGALAEFPGWRWIFWLLSILSGTCLLLIACFLPETARSVVGNGSTNASGAYRTIFSYVQTPRSSTPADISDRADNVVTLPPENATRKGFHVPNPAKSLKLLWAKDCILIVLIFGIFYMNLSCVQASTSALFIDLYGITELKAGLIYLPSGIGSIIGAYGAGYVLKYDYLMTARKHGIKINVKGGDDLTKFPIEEARLRSIAYSIGCAGISTIGYGWALHATVHIAIPLILQFVIGLSTAIVFSSSITLLTDVHSKSPSTASAANNIIRCLLAGAGLAVVQILFNNIGVQWTFTLFGIVCLGSLGMARMEWKFGRLWRDSMKERGIER